MRSATLISFFNDNRYHVPTGTNDEPLLLGLYHPSGHQIGISRCVDDGKLGERRAPMGSDTNASGAPCPRPGASSLRPYPSAGLLTGDSIHDNRVLEKEQWISNVKKKTRTKMNDPDQGIRGKPVKWNDNSWTPFINEVAEYLCIESETQEDVVHTLAGLLRYGVTNQAELVVAAGTPPTQKEFRDAMRAEGVEAAICDKLFLNYVSSVVTTIETGTLPLIGAFG